MKNKIGTAFCGLLFAATMMAQGPFGDLTSSTPIDPATRIANQVTRLTKLLTLTTQQASQATTIFTNAQATTTPLETTLTAQRTSLQTAVKTNAVASIDSLSTSIGSITGQLLAIRNRADAAFYALLTPAQQAILDAGRERGGPGGRGLGRR